MSDPTNTATIEQLQAQLQQLQAQVDASAPAEPEPARKPTLLDRFREAVDSHAAGDIAQAVGLAVDEIPGTQELAPLVGVLLKVLHELVDELDQREASSVPVDEPQQPDTPAAGATSPSESGGQGSVESPAADQGAQTGPGNPIFPPGPNPGAQA